MQHKKIKLCAFLLLVLGLTGLQAQEAIPATGGNASGSGGSVSYSVGQVVYATITETNGNVVQGVQQPYEISIETGLAGTKGITLECSVFPNPVTDFLILKVENYKTENLVYQLFDIHGKLLAQRKMEGPETRIDLRNPVISAYFLKVLQASSVSASQVIKTFKIIKH
jgi:hypothetical protein